MSVPTLVEMAESIASSQQRHEASMTPARRAAHDQGYTVVRNTLAGLGVDLGHPVAARAVMAVFELTAATYRTLGPIGACNAVTAAATVAARRHTSEA